MAENKKKQGNRPLLKFILPIRWGFQACIEHVYTVIHHVYHASEWYMLAVLACQMYRIKY